VARVRAVLRRIAPTTTTTTVERESGVLRFADLELHEDLHEVRRSNSVIELSPTEFALLRYLLENRGSVVSKAQIIAHVWSYDYTGNDSVVESYISTLRKKVDRFEPALIQTLRGIGYSLRVNRVALSETVR
jgi:two-component system OmpR family response regulator